MIKYLKQLKGKIQKVWSVEYSFNITFPLYWWSVIIGQKSYVYDTEEESNNFLHPLYFHSDILNAQIICNFETYSSI